MWNRFWKDMRKYFPFARYSARSDLKAEVASSYLNWLWWILNPLMFMLVYSFIAVIIFQSKIQYFPVFVFIGLTIWEFINRVIQTSVKAMRNNSAIVTKVYLPKYVLIIRMMLNQGFKMLISFGLVVIMMILYRVPVTWRIVFLIPIFTEVILFSFGASCIVMHFGVFIDDLHNVVQIILRIVFYMSGIFYQIDGRIDEPYRTMLLYVNPALSLIESARRCMLYSKMPYFGPMAAWAVISLLLCFIGVRVVYKYENSYVKIM